MLLTATKHLLGAMVALLPMGHVSGECYDEYYSYGRRLETSSSWEPCSGAMRGAICSGDPHCRTFDGRSYDCQADGEFVMLNSADTGAVVHARFEHLTNPAVSFVTGMAATEDGSSVIEVTESDGERSILIDGQPYDGGDFPATMTGVSLNVTDYYVTLRFPSELRVSVYTRSLSVFAPIDMPTVGLLGTNNGNRTDDWMDSATGETIERVEQGYGSAAVVEGYNYCASNWQAGDDSLFTSALRRSRHLQTTDEYTAPVLPEVIPTDVQELCGENTECIFDSIVVGLDEGAATLAAIQEFEAEVEAVGGDVCEENTFSSDGLVPCTDCPEGETSGRGAVVCEVTLVGELPTPSPTPEMLDLPPTPSPSTMDDTEGLAPLSLGCYADDRGDRIMDDLVLSDYSMTTELCELTCLGSTYFATQYGRECWCGSAEADYALHGESTDCTYPCSGDADQTCGGFDAASIYRYADESTPSPTPSPTAGGSPLSLGCYADDREDRIMDDLVLSDYSMTTELCETTCLGSTYFATQYGRECWCGSAGADYALHGESTDCTYPCAGEADQTCGGFDAANIYRYTDESSPNPTPSPLSPTPNPTPSPTAGDSPLQLGCYADDKGARIMDELALSTYSMTTELCELTCLGNTYFATQYGRECWCGSAEADYALHGESTDCTYACSGDADQTCGGFDAANIYLYTGENAPETSSFVGCYQDQSGARIMELARTDAVSMTKEVCEAECAGSEYFGMQYGSECFCGEESTDLLQHGESSSCTYACAGDSEQACGGFYAMSVYSYS